MNRRRDNLFYGVLAILLTISIASYSGAAWIHAKAVLAQVLLDEAWQESLTSGERVRAWSWSDTWPVARLSVPSQEVDLIVLEGGHGASLPFAPGHLAGSALPGYEGISVLVAHRDTHFSFLAALNKEESINITRNDGKMVSYRVTSSRIIDTRKEGMKIGSMNSQLVLVTCYPFDAIESGTPYRYVVIADAVITPNLRSM